MLFLNILVRCFAISHCWILCWFQFLESVYETGLQIVHSPFQTVRKTVYTKKQNINSVNLDYWLDYRLRFRNQFRRLVSRLASNQDLPLQASLQASILLYQLFCYFAYKSAYWFQKNEKKQEYTEPLLKFLTFAVKYV